MINKDLSTLEEYVNFTELDILNINYVLEDMGTSKYDYDKTFLEMQKEECINRLSLIYIDLKKNLDEVQKYIDNRYSEIKKSEN